MLKSTTNADCPYFVIHGYLSSLEFNHRAAHSKVIIIKLIHKHGYSSFVNLILHIILPNLNFVNRFNKNYNAKIAVFFQKQHRAKILLHGVEDTLN